MVLTTTAFKPVLAFTTTFRFTSPIAKQRLPVLQPDPTILRFTTGLIKGSRRPVRLITSACFFGWAGWFLSSTAILCLGCDFLAALFGFALAGFASAFGAAADFIAGGVLLAPGVFPAFAF